MINKKIGEITEEDLQALIDNSVLERKTMEYKQALPSDSDSSKKEFLADVSSFANASGGDLIYGIVEDRNTGCPKALDVLDIENTDQEKSRLDNMIRDGIQPRISGIQFEPVKLSNSKIALIIRIPKSWISPHRVTFRGHDKFYSRSTNGKYPLDVSELRIAFNLSDTIADRIRRFREDRISKIIANEMPVPFVNTPKIVLHLLPIISFSPAQSYDITKIYSDPRQMPPVHNSGLDYRLNFDGLLTYSQDKEGKKHSYTQLYKTGVIEAVEGRLLTVNEGKLLIPGYLYEWYLLHGLSYYLDVLKAINVDPPVFVFLTLLGVKGYSMGVDRAIGLDSERDKIDRDVLLLPEVVMESLDVIQHNVLKPCFDRIWNACGFPRSMNYDEKGKWTGK